MSLAELYNLYYEGRYNILANFFAACEDVHINYLFLLLIMRDYGRTGDMKLLRLSSLIYTDYRDHGDVALK